MKIRLQWLIRGRNFPRIGAKPILTEWDRNDFDRNDQGPKWPKFVSVNQYTRPPPSPKVGETLTLRLTVRIYQTNVPCCIQTTNTYKNYIAVLIYYTPRQKFSIFQLHSIFVINPVEKKKKCKLLTDDIIYGFGKTEYLSMCSLIFLSQIIRFKNFGGCDCYAVFLVNPPPLFFLLILIFCIQNVAQLKHTYHVKHETMKLVCYT